MHLTHHHVSHIAFYSFKLFFLLSSLVTSYISLLFFTSCLHTFLLFYVKLSNSHAYLMSVSIKCIAQVFEFTSIHPSCSPSVQRRTENTHNIGILQQTNQILFLLNIAFQLIATHYLCPLHAQPNYSCAVVFMPILWENWDEPRGSSFKYSFQPECQAGGQSVLCLHLKQ